MSVPITSPEEIDWWYKLQPMGFEIDDGADYVMPKVHQVNFAIWNPKDFPNDLLKTKSCHKVQGKWM